MRCPMKARLKAELYVFDFRKVEAATQASGTDHHLDRTLYPAECGLLEEVGMEDRSESGPNVAVVLHQLRRYKVDCFGVFRRDSLPGGNLSVVLYEEVVQMARQEAGGGRIGADDVYHIFAIEASSLAKELLLAVIVVFA